MSKICVEVGRIRNAGEDLKEIANDYKILINNMYEKVSSLPNSGAWSSENGNGSVNQYVEKVLKDKESTVKLSNSMNSLGNKLINYANKLNSIADDKI